MIPEISFDNSYAEKLEGFYVDWEADKSPEPKLVKANHALAKELGIDLSDLNDQMLAQFFSGSAIPDGAHTLAQVYAGHQFGGFSPQLGDGRALLLGEVIDPSGKRWDIQFKGSGRTPFSRGGDGKAAIGPVLREYLIAEAMHALGVPTTRALAAVTTGEHVWREQPLPGAVLTRVASSHVRVGTFQFFASRGETDKVKKLVDYVIWRHYPELETADNKALALLEAVCVRQAGLVAHWMSLGFIHGVMNTDNMTLSGETIDYGPCAFMDAYDPKTVFSSIDEHGRYAYGNQPALAQWNLARFAECLIDLISEDRNEAIGLATQCIEEFSDLYRTEWTQRMGRKLGLNEVEEADGELAAEFLKTMEGQQVDFTLGFRCLSEVLNGNEIPLRELYQTTALLDPWLQKWRKRIEDKERPSEDIISIMNAENPVYIPRNHEVEEALASATAGDLKPFETLIEVLSDPYVEQRGREEYAKPDPNGGKGFQTFCGT